VRAEPTAAEHGDVVSEGRQPARLEGDAMGENVILTCLGQAPGPKELDGRTGDGTVGLAPHTGPPFSGTSWSRTIHGDVWTLKCLGDIEGPRFLDGRTQDGTVGLAPSTEAPFSGTRWRATNTGQDFTLECLGEVEGARFLDGRTGDGTVGLAPNTEPPFTGTHWRVGIPFGDDNIGIGVDE